MVKVSCAFNKVHSNESNSTMVEGNQILSLVTPTCNLVTNS